MDKLRSKIWVICAGIFLFSAPVVWAAESGEAGHGGLGKSLLWIGVLLLAAGLSRLVERVGQPSVLGELVIGVIIGNLALLGISFFEPIKTDTLIPALAELGVIILLFQVGLESNISQMRKVGAKAFRVALVGVVVPFVLGAYVIGPWLMPGLDTYAYLFLGAALTATSVGITARVFKDLGKLKTPEAQIVLGAAVIDDVKGLIILAVISALVKLGSVSLAGVALIIANAVLFLVGAIVIGQLLAPRLSKLLSRIHTGQGMKFTLAMTFMLSFAFIAEEIGLASIVGSFAAGLVLDPVHFRFFGKSPLSAQIAEHSSNLDDASKQKIQTIVEHHDHRHVEDLIEPVAFFLVPIFFVYTGIGVNLETLFNPQILAVALGITVVAFLGKYVSGLVAGKGVNKSIIGFGMVPRGEVGLIFATIGKSLGVVNDEVFSVIVIMVILTTLLTPPILTYLLNKQSVEGVREAIA